MSGVFAVNPNYTQSTPYPILVFDDVYTTGSTLREAMSVLESEEVWGLTIAR
jgi:predicted amidophosphoribosyltransferase